MEYHTGRRLDDKRSIDLVVGRYRRGRGHNWQSTWKKDVWDETGPREQANSKATRGRKGGRKARRAGRERATYHACTKICFALSDALVVVAALTLAANFSRAWSGFMLILLLYAPTGLMVSGEMPPSIWGSANMALL